MKQQQLITHTDRLGPTTNVTQAEPLVGALSSTTWVSLPFFFFLVFTFTSAPLLPSSQPVFFFSTLLRFGRRYKCTKPYHQFQAAFIGTPLGYWAAATPQHSKCDASVENPPLQTLQTKNKTNKRTLDTFCLSALWTFTFCFTLFNA